MATINRRALAGVIAARLDTVTNATGHYVQVGRLLNGEREQDPPTKPDGIDQRIAPYFIYSPSTGGDGPDAAVGATCREDLTLPIRVTAVAGDIDDLLALVDRVDGALHLWRPTLTGAVVGRLRRPMGWQPMPPTPDHTINPPRLQCSLEYVCVATT